jgi:hypothetical protein
VASLVAQQAGELPWFDASESGLDAELWQTPTEVGLHSFGPGEMLAIDHMQDRQISA